MRKEVLQRIDSQWGFSFMPVLSTIGVFLIMTFMPEWRWENDRADSIFDGVVAIMTLTTSLLLLLGKIIQKEENENYLTFVFLVSGLLRFLSSATEHPDITIWIHRLCSLTLGFGFLVHWYPFPNKSKHFSLVLNVIGLSVTLFMGVCVFCNPSLFPSAFSHGKFSLGIEVISFLATSLFLISAFFQSRSSPSQNLNSFSFYITTFLFAYVALVYPFTRIWGGRWWFIQFIELAATLFLTFSLFTIHNRNVSETKNKLKSAVDQLQRSNLELENFSSIAAHDLAEPLRTIMSYCQLMKRNLASKLDPQTDQYLSFVIEGSKRMSTLINNLLAFSRVNMTESSLVEVDCNLLLSQILKNMEASLKDKGAEISIEKLPASLANPTLLTELFQNLIGNALKFQKPGSSPKISISGYEKDQRNVYSIADNGIGIEREFHDQIFSMFTRLNGIGEYSGSGIGLATCKKIIEMHNGNIWVESQLGEGSIFFFTLPRTCTHLNA
jgi:signal transduction histidine kinase